MLCSLRANRKAPTKRRASFPVSSRHGLNVEARLTGAVAEAFGLNVRGGSLDKNERAHLNSNVSIARLVNGSGLVGVDTSVDTTNSSQLVRAARQNESLVPLRHTIRYCRKQTQANQYQCLHGAYGSCRTRWCCSFDLVRVYSNATGVPAIVIRFK